MPQRVVTINVVSGSPQPWSFYAIYRAGERNVASRRMPNDLGWTMWQTSGMKDGVMAELVGIVRALGDEKIRFTHVYPCGPIMVVEEGDCTFGTPSRIDLEVEDA